MTQKAGAAQATGGPIVVIGLDAFDVDLLHRWSREGRLPFLRSLMERGVVARLESTQDLFSDAPWPSVNGGVSPAKHAFYNHLQLRRGTLEIERVDAQYCRQLPFWQYLKDTGLKVATLDVPKTFPIEGLDGIQVCAWGEHYPLLRTAVSIPSGALNDIISRFGEYPHPKEMPIPPSRDWEYRTYQTYIDNIERKRRATEYLLGLDDWDFFFSVFSEVHYADHQFYDHMEPSHWGHEPEAPDDLKEALPDVAARTDAALASIFAKLPPEATYVVLSVHGVETNFSANHLMVEVLEKLGFLTRAERQSSTNAIGSVLRWTSAIRELIPQRVRDFINDRLVPDAVHDEADSSALGGGFDWSRTRAFFLPSDHFHALLSLNLRGREPQGIVEPGTEADAVCEELASQLMHLTNPATGKPAVRDVVRIADKYEGANLSELPELVVRWAKDEPIQQLYHPDLGTIGEKSFVLRTAQHTADGFLIAGGPAIDVTATVRGARTIDLAPTLLHLLGQPVPDELEGRILAEMLVPKVRPAASVTDPARQAAAAKAQAGPVAGSSTAMGTSDPK